MPRPDFFDRLSETSTDSGNGDLSLLGAEPGFRAFSSVITSGTVQLIFIQNLDVPNEWEVIRCPVVNSSGWKIQRSNVNAIVEASTNAGSKVNFSAGLKRAFTVISAAVANLPRVTNYFGSFTHTVNPLANAVTALGVGVGASGGGGRQGASGSARGGGSGGGGGGFDEVTLPASALAATLSIVTGTGPAGGLGASATNTNGADGADGSDSTVSSGGQTILFAGGGKKGFGGIAGDQTNVGIGGKGKNPGGNGGVGRTATVGGDSTSGGGGGGGGGGFATTNATLNAAAGGSSSCGGGGSVGGVGGSVPNGIPKGGGGGGGGNPGPSFNAGGPGGKYGGGGGGGGASTNGSPAGNGGAGGDGIVTVIEW